MPRILFIPRDLFYDVTCEELEWERMLTGIDITNLINLGFAAVSLLLNHRAVIAQLGIVNIAVALQLIHVSALIHKLQRKKSRWVDKFKYEFIRADFKNKNLSEQS